MKSVILCSTPRSGSTLMCEHLALTGVLGRPGELFLPWLRQNEGQPQAFWKRHWDMAVERGSTANGVFGVKVMAHYAPAVQTRLARAVPGTTPDDALYEVLGAGDAVFIRLTRRNRLKQAVSRFMIRSTGVAHRADGEAPGRSSARPVSDDYNEAIPFSFSALRAILDRIAEEELWWDAWFAAHPHVRALSVEYETVVGDQSYLDTVAALLGVEAGFARPVPRLKRLSNHVNQLFCDLYHDVEVLVTASAMDEDAAIEHAVTARLAAAPQDPVLNFQRAAVLQRQGRMREARKAAMVAVEGRPANAHLLAFLGTLERISGRRRLAERSFRRALDLEDGALPAAHHELSLLLLGKDPAGAIVHARAALEAQPANALFWSGLGRAQAASGDRAGAEVALRKALEICPDLQSAHATLSTLHDAPRRRFTGTALLRRLTSWR